jgi:hypothetical protein
MANFLEYNPEQAYLLPPTACHRSRRKHLLHYRSGLRLWRIRRRLSSYGLPMAALPARRAKFRPRAILALTFCAVTNPSSV